MSRLSTSLRVVVSVAVVAQQLLRGLEARQRRRPLTRVLLAVEEDADLRAVAPLPDPQHVLLERARAGRGRWTARCQSRVPMGVTGWRKSDRFTFVRGCTIPVPASPRYVIALTSALAAGLALIASMTCAAVLDRSPVGVRRQRDEDVRPDDRDDQRRVRDAGSRSSAVTLLPPSWPQALDVRTTALVCRVAGGRVAGAGLAQKNGRRSRARASAAPSG